MKIVISDFREKILKAPEGAEGSDNKLLGKIETVIASEASENFEKLKESAEYSKSYNSAAYVALRQNLTDFLGNCFDAKADIITITIPNNSEIESANGRIAITISDNGEGFPKELLGNEEELKTSLGKKYSEIL